MAILSIGEPKTVFRVFPARVRLVSLARPGSVYLRGVRIEVGLQVAAVRGFLSRLRLRFTVDFDLPYLSCTD